MNKFLYALALFFSLLGCNPAQAAIQCNITQPTGVVATYHVIVNLTINPNNPVTVGGSTANFILASYLSSTAYQAGDQPLSTTRIDVSAFLGSPVNFTTFITQMITGLEGYVISTVPAFSGGTIVN